MLALCVFGKLDRFARDKNLCCSGNPWSLASGSALGSTWRALRKVQKLPTPLENHFSHRHVDGKSCEDGKPHRSVGRNNAKEVPVNGYPTPYLKDEAHVRKGRLLSFKPLTSAEPYTLPRASDLMKQKASAGMSGRP